MRATAANSCQTGCRQRCVEPKRYHCFSLTILGLLITLMQFILVAIFVYPSQSSARPPFFLKKTKIPLRVLFGSAAMFYTVNMLNNWAFAFDISVPVHIILRS